MIESKIGLTGEEAAELMTLFGRPDVAPLVQRQDAASGGVLCRLAARLAVEEGVGQVEVHNHQLVELPAWVVDGLMYADNLGGKGGTRPPAKVAPAATRKPTPPPMTAARRKKIAASVKAAHARRKGDQKATGRANPPDQAAGELDGSPLGTRYTMPADEPVHG